MRDDIHCAFDVQSLAANPSGGYTLSLTEFYNQCATVASQPGSGSTVYLAWCTIPTRAPRHVRPLPDERRVRRHGHAHGGRHRLSCVGWPGNQPGNVWPVSRTCETGYFKTQAVRPRREPRRDRSERALRAQGRDRPPKLDAQRRVHGTGAPAQLVFTTQPSGAVPNAAFPTSPVVTAEDGAGNIITSYSGTVALSIKSGTGTSGAALTGCSAVNVNGATTFTGCKIDKPGSGYVLVAADGAFMVESNPFDVAGRHRRRRSPLPDIRARPPPAPATHSRSPRRTRRQHRHRLHRHRPLHHQRRRRRSCPATTPSSAATTAPTPSRRDAEDRRHADDHRDRHRHRHDHRHQTGITVNPAAAATLVVAGYPSLGHRRHQPASFTVTAKDAFGNTATGYTGTVHFTSSDGAAVLPGELHLHRRRQRRPHLHNAYTLKTAGSQTLTATDTVTGTITGTSAGITVNPAAAATLDRRRLPRPRSPRASPTRVTVTAKDAFGNTATGYTGTVHFTSTDGAAVLPGELHLRRRRQRHPHLHQRVHPEDRRLAALTATDTVTGTITGTSAGDHRQPGRRSDLVVAGYAGLGHRRRHATRSPSPRRTPSATPPPATPAPSTSPPPTAPRVLPANYTFIGGDNGIHTFTDATPEDGRLADDHRDRHRHRHDHRHQHRRSPSTRPPRRRWRSSIARQPSAANTTCTGQPIAMGNSGNMTFNVQTRDPFGNASAPTSADHLLDRHERRDVHHHRGLPRDDHAAGERHGSVTLHHANNGTTATVTAQVTAGSGALR